MKQIEIEWHSHIWEKEKTDYLNLLNLISSNVSREDKVLFLELILGTVRRTKEQKIALTVWE